MRRAMLTTVDNPHSPFDDYSAWYAYDLAAGYHSGDYLARLVISSDELSEADLQLAIESTIDEIVRENINGVFRKVTREFPD